MEFILVLTIILFFALCSDKKTESESPRVASNSKKERNTGKENQASARVSLGWKSNGILVNLRAAPTLTREKAAVDMAEVKAYFERVEGKSLPMPKVNRKSDKLLREFILSGGIDLPG